MFQNKQKVVVVSSGDPARVIKVQSASGTPDPSRYPIVDTTGVSGRDQSVQIVSGGDPTRFPILRGVSDARGTADSVISALTPAAWYRNATGVTSAGGFASQWDDYSGNARHLVQAVGTNQPAYDSGTGVVLFDGADNFLQTGVISIAPPFTWFAVLKPLSWTSADAFFDGGALNQCVLGQVTSTPRVALTDGGGSAIAPNDNLALSATAIVVWGHKVAGSTNFIQVNETTETTGINALTSTLTRISMGNSFSARYAHMECQEAGLIAGVIDATQRAGLITALNNLFTVF